MPAWHLSASNNKLSSQDNLPPFQIYGSVGGSMWTTPLYLPDGSATSTMFGSELQAGISYAFGIYSLGVVYSEHHAPYTYMGVDCAADINYIGVSYGMRGKVSEHWVLNCVMGLGKVQYTDSATGYGATTDSGLGIHYSFGVDYLLSRHIAIGADIQYFVVRIGESDPESEYANGVKRLGANVGLKFYF